MASGTDDFTEAFIDPTGFEGTITRETRDSMAEMLDFGDIPVPLTTALQKERSSVQSLSPNFTSGTVHQSSFHPFSQSSNVPFNTLNSLNPLNTVMMPSMASSLIALIGRILEELQTNLPRLLSLNPSRRDAIAQYLDKLASIAPGVQSMGGKQDPSLNLRKWIDNPLGPSQEAALNTFFEEIALIALGQAIILKSWSDRGVRKWSELDLGRLNWALSTALKPLVPLDREGWQITRPNLYSWYSFSPRLQHEVWVSLDSWKIAEEGPNILMTLLGPLVRRSQSEILEPQGYDPRFFKALWQHLNTLGVLDSYSGPLKRNKIAFSPTLRDGGLVRTGPEDFTWIGLEASSFHLMMAELMQIWWGPGIPPFWSVGSGLEVHTRDQLALALGASKPSVICRIAEMEACDVAFVLEEQGVRTQGRNATSLRFKEQVEGLPYFKRIRSAGTTLGDLQACVALGKLRPGGFLWWAREEALSQKDGNEMLNFLLDRGKLICEWDFSELEHSLPSPLPLFPKHLYLFLKEPKIEVRLAHRPVRHSIQGQIRSHVELAPLLEDALQVNSLTNAFSATPRGHWTILSHTSPTTQQDWMEKWPDPTSQNMVRQLDLLRTVSLPLANFTTIRPTTEPHGPHGNHWSVQLALRGFWLTNENDSEGRKLVIHPLPQPKEEVQGSGFLVLVPDEAWVIPLKTYLVSDLVKKWLDCHAERRGERWLLNEQIVKWIPVPKILLKIMGVRSAFSQLEEEALWSNTLSYEWEGLLAEIPYQPKKVLSALETLGKEKTDPKIHAMVFLKAACAIDALCSEQSRLFSMVSSEGRIRWRELLNVLPKGERISIALHPRIRIAGSLPPHLPIGKLDKVKTPVAGILLSTESGFSLSIKSESPLLITMLLEQMEGLSHPTWNELLQYLQLPRKIELAESTALDVLRSHTEQTTKLKELYDLLTGCQLF